MSVPHDFFMEQAIAMGKKAHGLTGDNPNVGCVIVSPGDEILGKGHTHAPGEAHAEVDAVQDALSQGHSLLHSRLYVTVEPCCFHGRTPACTDLILQHSFAEVIVGILDPHPRVSGKGVQILKDAGLFVTVGVCESQVRMYLKEWLKSF